MYFLRTNLHPRDPWGLNRQIMRILFLLALAVSGCAVPTTGVVPRGQDMYAVTRQGATTLVNPCKQTRRNKERPRKDAPEPETLVAFLKWARERKGQAQVLASMAEFAALTGNRRIEFLELHWPQISDTEARLIRGKQRDKQVVEVISISPALAALLTRLRGLAKNDRLGAVFPNRAGNGTRNRDSRRCGQSWF